jgi:hypothetical protein
MTVEETHSLCFCPSSATAPRLDLTHAKDRLRNKQSAVSPADLRLAAKSVLACRLPVRWRCLLGVPIYLSSIIALSIRSLRRSARCRSSDWRCAPGIDHSLPAIRTTTPMEACLRGYNE